MELTALCISLMRPVMLLLVAHVDFSYSQKAAFPQVAPNRQQHFHYESFVVSCEGLEGLTGWRVMKRIGGVVQTCAPDWFKSTGPCEIKVAYSGLDSGAYWCVMGGSTSNTVNITVTDGPVILEGPLHPVTEGEAATLSCRDKQASPHLKATFSKDGRLMERSSTEHVNILSVSKSNEGLYRCSIPGAGESPESWLTVRAAAEGVEQPRRGPQLLLLLCIGAGVVFVALLLLGGLLQCMKRPATTTDPPTRASSLESSSPQTDEEHQPNDMLLYARVSVAVPIQATYAVVTKPRMEEEAGGSSHCSRIAATNPLSTEEDSFYSTIGYC